MPYTLPPLSRRRFLALAAGAAAACALPRPLPAAEATDADRVLLLSDTHIAADPAMMNRNVCMHDHLTRAIERIAASRLRPCHGFITGDLALNTGEAADYATLVKVLGPLREQGVPLHLGLGNHDHFERFRAAFPAAEGAKDPVALKHVTVVETPRANLMLLDSLGQTNVTPGVLGAQQLAWLAKELDARKDKPAVVLVHRNPQLQFTNGLTDTAAFYETIVPRKQVKAVCFGHTHRWEAATHDGIHLVNLPAVAYVFREGEPSGWVDLQLEDGRGTFTLHALDDAHPKQGEKLALSWRGDA